jgi:hypothetical protein
MTKSLCGKVVHFSKKDAEPHRDSLEERYGTPPNIYYCYICSKPPGEVWHVGYGKDGSKLSKRARRHRKQQAGKKKKHGT